jgi:signal peptidase
MVMKTFKRVFRWIGNVGLVLLVALAILSVYSFVKSKSTENYIPGVGGYKFLAVLSGSMNPTFNTYDMIIDKQTNSESLKSGDVITSWIGDSLVTHRITQVIKNGNDISFKTKGDANNVEDEGVISAKNVIGKYVFHIPYLGLVMSKIRGPLGIGVVWAVFIFIALNEILSEIFKAKKTKKVKEKEADGEDTSTADPTAFNHIIGNSESGYIS